MHIIITFKQQSISDRPRRLEEYMTFMEDVGLIARLRDQSADEYE
jgi:hypothetical protein